MDNNRAMRPEIKWSRDNNSTVLFSSSANQGGYPPAPPYSAQPQGYGYSQQMGGSRFGQQQNQQPYSLGRGQQCQPAIVTIQPATYSQLYPVSDYMGYSIFTMLCCCLPLGIAALFNSIATRDANSRGDRMAAEQSSKYAQILNHVGLGIGIVLYVTAIIIVVVLYTIILQS